MPDIPHLRMSGCVFDSQALLTRSGISPTPQGENMKLNRHIKIRLPDEEFNRIHILAKTAGLSVSAYLRKKGLQQNIRQNQLRLIDALSENAQALRSVAEKHSEQVNREEVLSLLNRTHELLLSIPLYGDDS